MEETIFPSLLAVNGKCDFCHENNVNTVEPNKLIEYFEPFLSIYNIDSNGEYLSTLLSSDWALFPSMDEANSLRLLVEVLGDGDIMKNKYIPKENEKEEKVLVWESLRKELMHKNRFFPEIKFDDEQLRNLLNYLFISSQSLSKDWHRARVQEGGDLFPLDLMGAPPEKKSTNGRANPVGIPYLYIASDSDTAISEIRPHTGELINVLKFTLKDNLKLVDLRNPKKMISPFSFGDEDDLGILRMDVEFLTKLGSELKRPVLPTVADIEYVPSQYICEFIKKCNFDGLVFNSSVGEGINMALFDPDKAISGTKVKQHKVTKVSVESNEV